MMYMSSPRKKPKFGAYSVILQFCSQLKIYTERLQKAIVDWLVSFMACQLFYYL